jgi:hypothetical protein
MFWADTKVFLMRACWALLNHPATQLLVSPACCCHELRRFVKGLYKVMKIRGRLDGDNSRRASLGRRNEKTYCPKIFRESCLLLLVMCATRIRPFSLSIVAQLVFSPTGHHIRSAPFVFPLKILRHPLKNGSESFTANDSCAWSRQRNAKREIRKPRCCCPKKALFPCS